MPLNTYIFCQLGSSNILQPNTEVQAGPPRVERSPGVLQSGRRPKGNTYVKIFQQFALTEYMYVLGGASQTFSLEPHQFSVALSPGFIPY